jgi:hypothetical protein
MFTFAALRSFVHSSGVLGQQLRGFFVPNIWQHFYKVFQRRDATRRTEKNCQITESQEKIAESDKIYRIRQNQLNPASRNQNTPD